MRRSSGLILHPSSLPSNQGIGNFGNSAFEFIDFLNGCGFKYWQMCPIGPTGYGDSPYQSFSSYAINPYFLDLSIFIKTKLIKNTDLNNLSNLSNNKIDYTGLYENFWPLIEKIYNNYLQQNNSIYLNHEYESFLLSNRLWIYDYCNYSSLKEKYNGKSRTTWNKEDIFKVNDLESFNSKTAEKYSFIQFILYKQFKELKKYAKEKGIKFIGDIPIFVSLDSADVWANSKNFDLDTYGQPINLSGVPPDYFSSTGQLWGNPLFNWSFLKDNNYSWWVERIKHNLSLYDILRIDHFRGFESSWAIPYGSKNAINGEWIKTPGTDFFNLLKKEIHDLPIIAEDLGIITKDVKKLLFHTGFPGMTILQFAFDDNKDNPYLLHNHIKNSVCYTGTHDNNTIKGWFKSLGKEMQKRVKEYIGTSKNISFGLILLALKSKANLSITTLQDIMALDSDSRMNVPSKSTGNWTWRFTKKQLEKVDKKLIYSMIVETGRL